MVTGGFAMQFDQVMFYVGPIAQVLYWAIVSACAVAAVRLLKRWVDHVTNMRGAAAVDSEAQGEPEVDIEPFVE